MCSRWKQLSVTTSCFAAALVLGCTDQVRTPLSPNLDKTASPRLPHREIQGRSTNVISGLAAESLLRATAELWIRGGDSSLAKTLQSPEWSHILKKSPKLESATYSDDAPLTASQLVTMVEEYNAIAEYPSVVSSATNATLGSNGYFSASTTMTMLGTHGKNDSDVELAGALTQTVKLADEGPVQMCTLAPGTVSGNAIKAFLDCVSILGVKSFTTAMIPATLSSICGVTGKAKGEHVAKAWVPGIALSAGVSGVVVSGEATFEVSPGYYRSSSVKVDVAKDISPQPACPYPQGVTISASAGGTSNTGGPFTTPPGPQLVTFSTTVANGSDTPYTYAWSINGTPSGVTGAIASLPLNIGTHTVTVEVKNKYNMVSPRSMTVIVPQIEEELQHYECNGVIQLTPEGCDDGGSGGGGGGGGGGGQCQELWIIYLVVYDPEENEWVATQVGYQYRPCE